jgi:hypothetical protein
MKMNQVGGHWSTDGREIKCMQSYLEKLRKGHALEDLRIILKYIGKK